MDPPLQVPNGLSGILHQEEGRNPAAGTRLLIVEWDNYQESLSYSLDFRTRQSITRRKVLHQTGRPVGIQQCADP